MLYSCFPVKLQQVQIKLGMLLRNIEFMNTSGCLNSREAECVLYPFTFSLPKKSKKLSIKAGVLACSLGSPLRLPRINSSDILQRTLRTTHSSGAAPDSNRISLFSLRATLNHKFLKINKAELHINS